MILLEVHNRIIEELLTLQIEAFLRKEKLVDLKSDVVGKCEDPVSINALNRRAPRFRWCSLSHHQLA